MRRITADEIVMQHMTNKLNEKLRREDEDCEIEQKWRELEDVPFNEDEDGELFLEENWFMFDKGTSREEIWHWFDMAHTKGVGWLLENI